MNRPIIRCLAAELIGTFALVFAGCGAVMVDAKTGQLGHVGVAIAFGLVIMFGIYAVGHISGAHFNAAVTYPDRRSFGGSGGSERCPVRPIHASSGLQQKLVEERS